MNLKHNHRTKQGLQFAELTSGQVYLAVAESSLPRKAANLDTGE